MVQSYRNIDSRLAHQIRLVMADVDGTLIESGELLSPEVFKTIRRFKEAGIMVGLVSGRTLSGLESMAAELEIGGPIIAENGGVARLAAGGRALDLGYSRRPAIEALEELKRLYPGAIVEREDNEDRFIDLVFRALGIETEELRSHLKDVELLDSGYILHLMQKGISKGKTLVELLPQIGDGTLSTAEVMVFGDSLTDLSLFEMFPQSVLVINPKLSSEHGETLRNVARYISELSFGDGFIEVALHILGRRSS